MNQQRVVGIQSIDMHYRNILKSIFEHKKIGGSIERVQRGARSLSYVMNIDNPLKLANTTSIAENVALACRSHNVIAMRQAGHIVYQIELPDRYWLQYFRGKHVNGLEVGLTDNKLPVLYNFDPPHSLVAGTTGAGKTYTAIAMILGLCESYTPEELSIVICDPHGDLDCFDNESHVVLFEWGSIASTYDEISKAIIWTHEQMTRRIENKVKDGRRIVLVVDEAETICANDKSSLNLLVDIGNQARKFNIYLLLTAKKPTQQTLPNLLNSLSNRWIGKCSLDKSSITRLIGQSVDISGLTKQGDFLHIDNDGTCRFLVATIRDNDFDKLERGGQFLINKTEDIILTDVGRPSAPVEMEPLAYYWWKGPDNISAREANDKFGFSRYYHEKYQEYIQVFAHAYMCFRKGDKK